MLIVRCLLCVPRSKSNLLSASVCPARDWHRRCFAVGAMNLNTRIKRLQEDKRQIIERLRQEEAKASTRLRKRETRAKIILEAVVLGMRKDEREAILSMLLPHAVERDRQFVSEHLADNESGGDAPPSGLN